MGNTRVMLVKCKWAPWQVIVYKLVKTGGAMFFLIYGCVLLLESEVNNIDIFLLWVFAALTFWAEMAFRTNTQD